MKETVIIYASTSGNCEGVARRIPVRVEAIKPEL